jgi:cystathionine beta-synthase
MNSERKKLEYFESILDKIGNTPLVKLNKLNRGLKPKIFAKLESANPGGSVKDRIGKAMIEDAEKRGELKPGGTIIEATSGNTGIGLALSAAVKGYKSVFVVTDKVSQEKINYLKALGSEVIVVSNAEAPDSPEYYVNVAKRLSRDIENSIFAYQYSNPANPEIHYKTTGPEIWHQTRGEITHFVAGIGTGGTISGVGKYLKEKNRGIKIIGADPIGSIFKEYKETGKVSQGLPYLVEGIGQDCLPENVDFEVIDKIYNIGDAKSISAARLLATEEGIFSGGSTGTILAAALQLAEKLTENDTIVFIVCDTGERYLSKVYNIEWLREHGLLKPEKGKLRDILAIKRKSGIERLVSVDSSTLIKDVIKLIQEEGFSQLPVIDDGKAIGCIKGWKLSSRLLENYELLESPALKIIDDCFPVLDIDSGIEKVKEELKESQAVLVEEKGNIIDLITRYDLIEYMSENK